jgi:hypothetical protein
MRWSGAFRMVLGRSPASSGLKHFSERARISPPNLRLAAVALCCAALLIPMEAMAGLTLKLDSDSGASLDIDDNSLNDDDPTVGVVLFNGIFDGDVVVATGISKPILGSASQAELSLAGVSIAASSGVLMITVTDTDYLLSPSTGPATLASSVGGTTDGLSTFQSYVDTSNTACGTAGATVTTTGLQGPFGPGPFDDSAITSFTQDGDFSLTIVAMLDLGAGEIQSFGADTTVTPEEVGGEGCTPGFWKNHLDVWPIDPDTPFADIFDDAFPGMTLGDVVDLKGGGLNRLGAHTVAALLNALSPHVDYPLTAGEVIDMFNDAFQSGDYNDTKDIFVEFNELGCPID